MWMGIGRIRFGQRIVARGSIAETEQSVVILAVLHLRRDARVWRGRS
jgi:hypothetical protein